MSHFHAWERRTIKIISTKICYELTWFSFKMQFFTFLAQVSFNSEFDLAHLLKSFNWFKMFNMYSMKCFIILLSYINVESFFLTFIRTSVASQTLICITSAVQCSAVRNERNSKITLPNPTVEYSTNHIRIYKFTCPYLLCLISIFT